ncbi:alpha-tocopherol transfer protein-like [Zophobas morio]
MVLPYEFDVKTLITDGRTNNKNVREIQRWLKTSSMPSLHVESIALFLISCDNDISATETTIKKFFKIKSEAPEIFNDRDIDNEILTKTREVILACSVPKRLQNSVIHCYKLSDIDYRNFILSDIFKLGFMIIDVSQRYDPPDELIAIIDMEGLGAMHLTRLKVSVIKTFVDFLQDGMALKIKNIHVLNTNYIAEKFIAIAKLFMNKALADALIVHPIGMNMEEFYKEYVPASHLPQEYGGELPSFTTLHEVSIQQLRELKPLFEAEDKLISVYKATNS